MIRQRLAAPLFGGVLAVEAHGSIGSGVMWDWVLEFSHIRRARRAAGAAILPLVEGSRRRLGRLPEAAWSTPYMIGFMAMLITVVSRMEVGKIGSRALCDVQSKIWSKVTRQSQPIGEEIILLSAARNHEFETGCRNAIVLGSTLMTNRWSAPDFAAEFHMPQLDPALASAVSEDNLLDMWEKFFERHMSAYLHYTSETDQVL